jgi:integrase
MRAGATALHAPGRAIASGVSVGGAGAGACFGFTTAGAAASRAFFAALRAAKGSGWLIRLHEKGGKQHMMPCHHALAEALHAYIAAAGIGADKKAFLFRTSRGHGGIALADQPMTQVDAWRWASARAGRCGCKRRSPPSGRHWREITRGRRNAALNWH